MVSAFEGASHSPQRAPRGAARPAPNGGALTTLTLLGHFSLSIGGRQVQLSPSAQQLLVLLALRGRQRRVYLAGTLWPEVRDAQALARLRSTLWRVRRTAPSVLTVEEQSICLDDQVEVDALQLASIAHVITDGAPDPDGLSRSFRQLVNAGELLAGWYEDWVIQEREHLSYLRVHALEVLVDQLLAVGRHSEALEAAMTAVRADPLRESTHRAVMRVHLAEGNPASAKRQVERYKSILHSELGAGEPTPAMLELLSSTTPPFNESGHNP